MMDLQRFAEERQLPATPRRRQEARRRGQVAKSIELGPAAALLAAALALTAAAPAAARGFAAWSASVWGAAGPWEPSPPAVAVLIRSALVAGLRLMAPATLAAMAASVGAAAVQAGGSFSLHPLRPDLGRIHPARGLERLVSLRSLADWLRAALKACAVALAAWGPAAAAASQLMAGEAVDVGQAAAVVGRSAAAVLVRAAVALLAVALADVVYQRWEHERTLRMTRQEWKEDLREAEGDPAIRARRRRRQRELARRRMMAEVRRADVVITNPVHYAVALRYKPGEMEAPVVVAKGRGLLAQRIQEMARRAGVVVLENPPLAQALYRSVPIGRMIPPSLYQAVAEVLAFVWRLKGRV